MPILIDGHNLIGRLPMLSLEDPDDEEKLVRLLRSYRARTGKRITVVFDAGENSSLAHTRQLGGIQIIFAPRGRTADALIAKRVQQSRDPRAWLVVTSDRNLAQVVGQHGARVQSAEDFAARMEPPASRSIEWKDTPLSPNEVEVWLSLFEDQD
jgi:predicted RNA-binding protein with PIN domain